MHFSNGVGIRQIRIASCHLSSPRFLRLSSTINSDDKKKTISKFKLLCLLQEYTICVVLCA